MNILKVSSFLFVLFNLISVNAFANPSDLETPLYKKEVPEQYFACQTHNECTIVQGWCSTFAIHKSYLNQYKEFVLHTKSESSLQCPPGWLPPKPEAVCIKQQCAIISNMNK